MRRIPLLSLLILISFFTKAGSQVSGYISVKYVNSRTYIATIVTYSQGDPQNSGTCGSNDLDSLRINWGDGTSDIVYRSNGNIYAPDTIPGGVTVCTCNKMNIYTSRQHTFPGTGSFHIWVNAMTRVGSITNIPNSQNDGMVIYNSLVIDTLGHNVTSPTINNAPICSYGCTTQCYNFNLGAVPNGTDSLSYSLGNCQGAPGYYIPSNVSINPVTGELSWCNPDSLGAYNFSIIITTLRKVIISGTVYHITVDTMEVELQTQITNNCTEGINELSNTGSYSIYPNPAENMVTITGTDESMKQVTIYNMVGQSVLSTETTNKQFTVNTSGLSSGVYFVNIKEESGRSYTMKLVRE
jgi:hypothetical protein